MTTVSESAPTAPAGAEAPLDAASAAPEVRPEPKPELNPAIKPELAKAPVQEVPKSVIAAQTALMRARARATAAHVNASSARRYAPVAAGLAVALAVGALVGGFVSHKLQNRALTAAHHETEQVRSVLAMTQWKGTGAVANPRDAQKLASDLRGLRAAVDVVKASVDRTAGSDEIRALEKRVATLRDSLEKSRAETAVAVAQIGAQAERAKADSAGALAQVAAQIARLEQFEREPAARIAAIAEKLDRADRQRDPVTTASIAPAPAAAAAAPPEAPVAAAAKAPAKPESLKGWSVRGVFNGIALLEGPGGLYEVARGDVLPGIGRVDAIERIGKSWTVQTSKGVVGG
ncbi:hypothetical protein GCM10007036_44710 [Alsobacter metallidurans]|uniref:Uncharacterized protein n=1 Tax=Alsobacter metallidurans TaxID=340221 RepID=A0A917IB38_9HYPH|nr:hypothetical protein [Alsobacter metallidurans]GGH32660.1 hypothetical protein GCM10007036_44710 [Alsobacter metallidurans]